ncbi:MAG: threonine synthase [Elusimicrobia bacterium]|nr:threonine synthase [Elusimicrobiota bacterium]
MPETMAGLINRWRERLPVSAQTPVITLHEGNTPLVLAPRLAKRAGLGPEAVWLKIEGANPTGSFKDRGMTMAVSKAVEAGAKGVLCASTGNTAASAAAYAARAGLRCVVLLPEGAVALGKLAQALAHGAETVMVKGNFDDALRLAREGAGGTWALVNSVNPYRLEGQKTASFEVVEALGRAPDYHFLPVGNAGNITAYWRGYKEFDVERGSGRPRMMGWQAAGAAPFILGRPVAKPNTKATAIRIGNPASWDLAITAREESRGEIGAVTDKAIFEAYGLLAREDGVFCEPSSAASAAGLLAFAKKGGFKKASADLKVVLTLTGNGLKDPDSAKTLKSRIRTCSADAAAFKRLLAKT